MMTSKTDLGQFATLMIGGERFDVGSVSWAPVVEPIEPKPPPSVTMSFSCDVQADVSALRTLFVEFPARPRHTFTLHGFDRNGQPITETIEVDEIDFVIVRRGKKRPGQWTDRTRAKRHERLMRADERRAGISRRGLVRGFPMRSLSSIHAECAELLRKADARLLEQTFNDWLASDPHVAAGVRMRIERPEGEP